MRLFLLAIPLIFGLSGLLPAATTTSQQVTITVQSINELVTSASPGSLVVNTAVAGQEPNTVTDASTTYSFSTNDATRRITGQLSANMPAGTTLEVELAAPGGTWTSAGKKTLSTTSVNLATGNRGRAQNITITYTFSATTAAGVVAPGSRTTTFTLTAQ